MRAAASFVLYTAMSALAGLAAYAVGLPNECSLLAGAGVGAVMLNIESRRRH